MAALTQEIDMIDAIGQMGIEVDGPISADIELPGQPGKTRPVQYVTLYMTAPPYSPVQVKETMVPSTLRKKHRDKDRPELIGKPVFSRTPVHEIEKGAVTCLLHPDRPESAQYRAMGLRVCLTASFQSEYEAERHMRNKHKSEWQTIQAAREREEKGESKSIQQATLEALQAQTAALMAMAGGNGAIAPVQAAPVAAAPKVERPPMLCTEDGCEFSTEGIPGLPHIVMAKHRKDAHGGSATE